MNSNENSNSSSKKDLFTTNSIASNFLEKIEKFRKHANNATISSGGSSNSNSLLNFGLSFHKKSSENDENSNEDCVVNVTNLSIPPSPSNTSTTNHDESQNEFEPSNITHSQSATTIDSYLATNDNNSFDSTVNSVKRKLLTKKKSLELSFENIKILKNRTQTSTKQNEKMISNSMSENILFQKSLDEEVKIDDNNYEASKDETNNLTKNETLHDIKLDKLFPDGENEFENNNDKKLNIENSKTGNWLINNKYKVLFISIIIYYLINNSSFLNGLIIGTSIASFISFCYYKINYKNFQDKVDETQQQQQNNVLNYKNKLLVLEKSDKNFCGVYKGWMNELREKYSPSTYFLNKTYSVYISLDYDKLRIQTTDLEIPKRVIPNEAIPKPKFNDQRIYELKDCEVSLLPVELVRKRFWSKKYPICLKKLKLLSKSSLLNESSSASNNNENTPAGLDEEKLENQLILFARCDREKEEWFNLFKKASKTQLLSSADYMKSLNLNKKAEQSKPLDNSCDASNDSLKNLNEPTNHERTLKFLNVFLLRAFSDFFTHEQWIKKIKEKIQRKINTIKVPNFIDELTILDIDLGMTIPLVKNTHEPFSDEKGLWVHLDIDYNGGFKMSLATKLNLMSLKKYKLLDAVNSEVVENKLQSSSSRPRHLGMLNSDEEDSPDEDSPDEATVVNDDENSNKSNRKFMNIVNKIASSSYFQKATENKFIRMAMENVSNTQIILTVEVKRVTGVLALNIPPHPSDRLWYGFITNPILNLDIIPQVGEKEVSYTAVTEWISDRLKLEFQKIFVFPNMDDVYFDILKSEVNF